jgi:hypothetical protein
VGTTIDFRAFAAARKRRNITFHPLLCQNCLQTPDIPLARRLILSMASLFNFMCEYFLNTGESL